jgi:hypothetical protein
MEKSTLRIDAERWRFLVMERTKPDKITPRPFQTDVRADYLDDISARPYFLDLVLPEPRHRQSITCAKRSG